MTGQSAFATPRSGGGTTVTLVEGSSFCISEPTGDIRPGTTQGLYFQDTRLMDLWELRVDGRQLEHLSVIAPEPWRSTFLARANSDGKQSESNVLVQRMRFVGQGMREDLNVRNLSGKPQNVRLEILVHSDFADLFEVKEGNVRSRAAVSTWSEEHGVRLTRSYSGGRSRGIQVSWPGCVADGARLTLDLALPARAQMSSVIEVLPIVDDELLEPSFPTNRPVELAAPATVARAWRDGSTHFSTDSAPLSRTLIRSKEDLGALRIVDPARPDDVVLAAGAPWFMALFGRDSLIASYMSLLLDPALALGTLKTLARLQGLRSDPESEEEPGRILHELRSGARPSLAVGGRHAYYGTADATPLFVVVLGELMRWGTPLAEIAELVPHADRALEWIDQLGDRDGDLFVEYRRTTGRGLVNQGWKDSWDGVNHADGTIATPPVALCEVQGYTYSALLARAAIAEALGDDRASERCRSRAARLKAAFNDRYWLDDRGWFAVALDGDKKPVDALASNMGHCLWSGIVDEALAPQVAAHLISPELFSGWGIRTLATSMGAYNPMSYHNGSVWPHDNALIIAGLVRYGFIAEAQRVADGLLRAADTFDGRLPELFCGFDEKDFDEPVPCPTSCSPQAWASAAPLSILRSLLRFDPDIAQGVVRCAPVLPGDAQPLTISNIRLGRSVASLEVAAGRATFSGLPKEMKLSGSAVLGHSSKE